MSARARPCTCHYHQGLGSLQREGRVQRMIYTGSMYVSLYCVQVVCMFFTSNRSFYPSTSRTCSALHDAQMHTQWWCFAFTRCRHVRARTPFYCPLLLSRPWARFNERASADANPCTSTFTRSYPAYFARSKYSTGHIIRKRSIRKAG